METTKINLEKLSDLANLNKAVTKKNDSQRNSYNYSKIVDNIEALNILCSLNLSKEQINDIKKNKSNFVNNKTKNGLNDFYTIVSKKIRHYNQSLYYPKTEKLYKESNNFETLLETRKTFAQLAF